MTDPMNARDRLLAVVLKARRQNLSGVETADAVLAILPDMVVPLVWSQTGAGVKSNFGGTRYYIGSSGVHFHLEIDAAEYGKSHEGFHFTLEDAKAAANARNVSQGLSIFGIGVDK